MKRLTLYGYPKCGTCRGAQKWLEARGWEVNAIDLTQTPPSETGLAELIAQSGEDIKKFFNVSGEAYKQMKVKDLLPGMADQDKIKLLASNGWLLKRPIVTDGSKTTVGYKEETYDRIWG